MFLSYARSSEEQATFAEQVLRSEGYSVWRDTELPAHLSYAEVIEERLNSAKAVLVLWSAEAAKSQWVRAEADAARERGTLIQSSVDGTVPPIPFNQIQCADLKGWSGESDHSGWRKLHRSIVALAGQAEEPVKTAKQRGISSICVLPFHNRSGDAIPDYFSDGLSEDITSDLAKVATLSVTPFKTALEFTGKDVDPRSVAEQLGVDYVLEGAVRRAGDRVRITAQLIDGSTGEQAWSDRYYRDFNDIFSVQDEISTTIVDALKARLLPKDGRVGEEPDASSKGDRSKAKKAPAEDEPEKSPSAFMFDSRTSGKADRDIAAADAPISVFDRNFDDGSAPDVADSEGEPSADEDWDSDDDEWGAEKSWRRRGFRNSDMKPRLIALALMLLVAAGLFGYFYLPNRATAVAQEPEKFSYTIIATVNVRSLPSRYNSRILGTLEKGETINIVPALAGATPDWLKLKDGPYIGGYVWRESTRPLAGSGKPDGLDPVKNVAQRKDVTG